MEDISEEEAMDDFNDMPSIDIGNGAAISVSYHSTDGKHTTELKLTVVGRVVDELEDVNRIHHEILDKFDVTRKIRKEVNEDVGFR
jgi:hypothetical protein